MSEEIGLSVIIPCKNQAAGVKRTLSEITEYSKKFDFDWEVIYADGGSTDKSIETAESFEGKIKNLTIVHESALGMGTGKGAAVKAGMLKAKGKIRMFMDADSSTPIKEIDKLLPYFKEGYDVVMGSRYTNKPLPAVHKPFKAFLQALKEVFEVLIYGYSKSNNMVKKQGRFRQLVSRGANLSFVVLLGQSYADTRCGFKAYTDKAAETIFSLQTLPGWGFDTEILMIAEKYKYKIIEVPITWIDDAEISDMTLSGIFGSYIEIFKIKWNKLSGKYSGAKAE
ncbi:MAG: glycosyltransferase [Patescibacteria group bacterium]